MAYTRLGEGTTVFVDSLESGDVIAKCKCGGDILAFQQDDDLDWIAFCDVCDEYSEWISDTPQELNDDAGVDPSADSHMLANVIPISSRRSA